MKKHYSKFLITLLSIVLLIVPLVIFAATNLGLDAANPGLGENDVKSIITTIINTALGFLGIIAVGFILYAGFVWMTAGGNAEKIDKAKKILIRATIGLVIILSSFAIVSFIINNLSDATGLTDSTSSTGTSLSGGIGGSANLVVNNWQPYDGASGTARNIMTRVYFNKIIDASSVTNSDFSFIRVSDGSAVSFYLEVVGSRIDIHPLVLCDVDGVEYCLGDTVQYRVAVNNGSITSVDNKDLVCTTGCSTTYTTSDYIDVSAPSVSLINPQENSTFSVAATVDIQAQAEDDSGVVAAMTFYADNTEVTPVGTDGAEPWEGEFEVSGYDAGDSVDINATAEDLSGNVGTSGDTIIRILPEYCFNQVQDGDETGIDCGGSCGGCLGDSCDSDISTNICEPSDSLCGQGVCNLECVCALSPIIDNIAPADGASGNYVTITGDGFGSSVGTVVFLGSDQVGDEKTAPLADCVVAWSPSQVIIEVPTGAVGGGIKLTTSEGDFDTTLDDRGWQGDFVVNTTIRPGVCGVDPETGTALSNINITGTQFGETMDRVIIGGITVNSADIDLWSNTDITSLVPNLSTGNVSVVVGVGEELSNPIRFRIVADGLTPSISYLEPASGPIGQYVTIHGDNFGFNEADVLVNFINGDTIVAADIDFPAMCGDYSVNNNEILVKVPDGLSLGWWDVVVNRDQKLSDPIGFNVTGDVLAPGLCLLEPNNGPVGTLVDAYGEGFGGAGQFTFYNNINASVASWSDGHISSQVPNGAGTGPVKAISSNGGISNTVNFSVGSCDANSCSSGDECCSDSICREIGSCEQSLGADEYIWSFTTGQQLPPFVVEDVWPVCDTVCLNTMIGVEFSNPVDIASLNDISIDVKQCTDENCTAFVSEVGYTGADIPVGYYDATNYILNINPAGNLEPESYYRVILKSGSLGIVNEEGGYLENINYSSTGGELDSYSWIFMTGIDECTLDNVEVLPEGYTIHTQNEKLNMTGYPFSEPDSCSARGQALDPVDFSWSWQSTSKATATVTGIDYKSVVTPVWGHPGKTNIVATADSVDGSSLVEVDMDIPRIDSISPDNGMINENLKTYVTIHGANFGDEQGSTSVLVGGEVANVADCSSAWSDTQIVIEMPLSTKTGDTIQIIKTGGDDESSLFTVNNIIRPALCSINPVYGTDGTRVTLTGHNFGDTQNDSVVLFDQLGVNIVDDWSNTRIKTRVPSGVATGPVVVNILGNDSNSVIFSMEPYITKLDPDNGSVNSYVSIIGGNFEANQGDGYVMIGNQRAFLAPCANSWSNTKIIVQVPEGLSLGNKDVQVVTHYGVLSNTINYNVNDKPLNPLLCEIDPEWTAVNERVVLKGDNFGDAPYLANQVTVDSKLGAEYDNLNTNHCLTGDGNYVGSCVNLWVEYTFNFTNSGYYNAWAETENYSMDLTDQGIYQNVNVYLDGNYIGYFSNPASTPDHQTGSVGLGWVNAGNHTVRYYWTNDWCGGCGSGVGDSNIRFHNVGINTGAPMSYPIFTDNYVGISETWANNRVPTFVEEGMQSGPVSLVTQVAVGQQCAGFHIGDWCPGGEYEDIYETVKSNSVEFMKSCIIGTTSSRDPDFIPTVAANSEAVGTLATDGKYIYGKSWGGYDRGDNTISIIGSGYQGTTLGQDYGDLATVAGSLNMTYHSDGFLYNGITAADQLEKIDAESGSVGVITVPTGLMERSTGNLNTGGWKLITSDGRYFYNLAYSHDGGSYNGFKVRVYDVSNNWELVREWISGMESFYTDGIIADGKYVYAVQWGGAHKIRKMNAITGEFVAEWVSEQGNGGSNGSGNDIISGQYDWVNDRVWIGDLVDWDRAPGPAYIYKYNSCNSEIVDAPLNCGDGILQLDEGEQCDAIVKEDGEVASDWEVYDASPAGQYSTVYDDELKRNVIQLQTDGGTATGFRLGNTGPAGDAWNYAGPNWDIQWRMKTFGGYRVYISTETTLGHRYITYPSGHGGNNYVPIDMPAIYTDGNWHYVYRDLQADLETEEPGNQILEVNGFLIRGNTRVVDIAIGADLNGQQCSDLGDYNAGIIACDVSVCQLAGNDCALGEGFCGDGAIQWPNANNEYEMCDGAASLPAPVAYWAMDEDNWTVGVENDVLDSVGTNHGQVMQSGIRTIGGGQNGRAGDFTASGNIAIPISSDLEIQNNLTMSAWVYPRSRNVDDEDIIILGQGAYYLAIGNDGSLRTYWYGKSNEGYHSSVTEAVPLNQWSHIAAVWDDDSDQVKLFINGQLVYTVNSSGSGNTAVNQVWLGAENGNGTYRQYDGLMDEVKIWDVALSAQEVNAEYLGSTQNCTNECTLPAVCGNDVVEYGEDCDDGNLIDGDGCSSMCIVDDAIAECNNGIIEFGEDCDFTSDQDPIFGGETCATWGDYLGGSLGCSDECLIILDECIAGNPTGNVCTNTEISAEFDALMDHSSFIGNVSFERVLGDYCVDGPFAGDSCTVDDDCYDSPCVTQYENVPITIGLEDIPPNDSQYSKVYIYPSGGDLEVNTEYRATVAGGLNGVQDVEGNTLSADYIWPFFTGNMQCSIQRVEITPSSYQFNNSDEVVNFTVHGYDGNNNTVVGNYSWEVQGDGQLVSLVGTSSQTVQVSATGIGNGELSLSATVDSGDYGSGYTDVPINIFLCNVPWEYENEVYNFKTRYCRGEGVNHVYNSGFEIDDNSDGVPDAWGLSNDYTNGKVLNGYNWNMTSSSFMIKPNATYTISASSAQNSTGNTTMARIIVQTCDNAGDCSDSSQAGAVDGMGTCIIEVNNHPQNVDLRFTPASTDMERNSCWFRTNNSVRSAKIQLLTNGVGDGPVWFDDIQLELGDESTIYEESNLLPALILSPDSATGDELLNILFLQSDYNIPDAIGLRIFRNFEHVSPSSWYLDNVSNIGAPTSISVDGYSGLQEGRTTYVNATNNSAGNIHTNIFVLSYTQGANNTTQDIFSQMYNNWTFNNNIQSFNEKQKLINDTHRWEDIKQIVKQLDDYYQVNADYPDLSVGTYQAGTTVSAWDSWQNTLGTQLGGLPTDPINAHGVCGGDYDPITCWDPDQLNYFCPLNSHVYQYNYINGGYYLYSNFEVDGVTWIGNENLPVLFSNQCDNIEFTENSVTSNGDLCPHKPCQETID